MDKDHLAWPLQDPIGLPPISEPNPETSHSDAVDLEKSDDLENAIGAALGLLGFLSQPDTEQERAQIHEGASETDNFDVSDQLAKVVGEACLTLESQLELEVDQSSATVNKDHESEQTLIPENESNKHHEHNNQEHADLDEEMYAGGQAYEEHSNTDEDALARQLAAEIASNMSEDVEPAIKQEEESNVDLESAISDVFKNLSNTMELEQANRVEPEQSEHGEQQSNQAQLSGQPESTGLIASQMGESGELDEAATDDHQPKASAEGSERSEGVGGQSATPHEGAEGTAEGEINLEDVIGQAFRAIIDPNLQSEVLSKPEDQNYGQDENTTQKEEEPEKETAAEDLVLDLEGIVQNVVQQMARENADTSNPSRSSNYQHKDAPAVPSLDDNVLEHFQNTSSRETHSEYANSAYMSQSHSIPSQKDRINDNEKDSELEKLQMNEILQNAFNMAMLNPHELLDEETEGGDKSMQARMSADSSTAAAIAVLAAETVLDEQAKFQNGNAPTDARGKSMSIAETLALHRSSMASENRDVLDLQSIRASLQNDGTNPIHPQLSNILSSLSLHIQSGTQSQNLMLVIRQMTNSLMLNKNFSLNVNTTVLRLLMEVNNMPEEKEFVVKSLRRTQLFLNERAADEGASRALSLIGNVLALLVPKNSGNLNTEPDNNSSFETPSIASFYDHALSTLSNFSTSRLRNAILGIKPDTDSLEYKERIRNENRERKKKWREENAERNKDNDLRSRVIKRATNMFGEGQLPEKRAWIEEEFTRRREKRFTRQKQEEAKIKRLGLEVQPSSTEEKPDPDSMANDSSLVRRMTDIFNLVAECGTDGDPKAVMTAVSAAIAVATSSHVENLELGDPKPMQSAMSSILNTILETNVKSGSYKRIPFLAKEIGKNSNLPNVDSNMQAKYASLTGVGNSVALSGSPFPLDAMKTAQKRYGTDLYTSDFKRSKAAEVNEFTQHNITKDSQIDYNLTPASSSLWNTTSGLKMPQYMKQATTPLPKAPSKGLSQVMPRGSSPFLSNKNNYDLKMGVSGGLKRPGTFQKPMVKGGEKSGKPIPFPTFYSSMFSQK